MAKTNQYTMCFRHLNGPQVNILLHIAAKNCTPLHQHLGFPNKMLYYFFERLQYFFELDLQQFMKEQVNSYFTLLEINIITRRWGYMYVYSICNVHISLSICIYIYIHIYIYIYIIHIHTYIYIYIYISSALRA